jgi:hypothetical protein
VIGRDHVIAHAQTEALSRFEEPMQIAASSRANGKSLIEAFGLNNLNRATRLNYLNRWNSLSGCAMCQT